MILRAIYICLFVPAVLTIYSGASVNFQSYPFFATLIFTNSAGTSSWLCGGSLVNSSAIITAAHCTKGADRVYIYLNQSVMLSPYTPASSVVSSVMYYHPSYSTSTYYHDIGFVILPNSSNITTMSIANSTSFSALKSCELLEIVGRGYSCNGGCLTNNLQYLTLPIIPQSSCVGSDYATQWPSYIVGNDLCLGYDDVCTTTDPTLRMDATCSGDSGGPLFKGGTQFGVVSRGSSKGCGQSTNADIFSSFGDSLNLQFITQILNQDYNFSHFETAPSSSDSNNARRNYKIGTSLISSLIITTFVV